jgi:hypothetical protein
MSVARVYEKLEQRRSTVGADPHSAILSLQLSDLKAPLLVDSAILGERVWLVGNDQQAAQVRAKGGIADLPEEVGILKELAATVTPEALAERLRLIHQAKKELGGSLEAYVRPDPKDRLRHLLDTWASVVDAPIPQEAVDRLKNEIMNIFHAYPEAESWFKEWRARHPDARLC